MFSFIIMMCGLFSIFDPSQMDGGDMKWAVGLLPLTFLFQVFGMFFSSFKGGGVVGFLESVGQALPQVREGGIILLSVGLTLFLFSGIGLVPFTFSVTSHLAVTLSLSMSLWFSGFFLGVVKSWKSVVSHLLPKGSPPVLWPFLIIIETVSLFIRPFTLAVRLMANVMAGHLILSLIGSASSHMFFLLPSSLMSMVFLGFEVGVSLVQAYVFVSLLSLYWGE
nr:ATP synthase F0 subunit 6 [Quadraceps punctatus]